MSNEELQVQIDTFMKQGFKPTSPAVSGLTQGGRTSPEGYRKSYEAQGYTPRYGNENAMDLKEGDRIRSSVIIPSQGKIDSDRGAEEDFRDLLSGSDARIMGEIARRQNMPGGGNDWRMAKLKGEMTEREYRKKADIEQKKQYREEDEYHRKAIEADRKVRNIQDIEGKLRRLQGSPTYNMPEGREQVVPGTGIYQNEKARPGFLGGFSNIGVTEQPRTLTPADQKEVQGLEERRRELEAAIQGKVYTPSKTTKAEMSPTDKLQKSMFESQIKGIDAEIRKVQSGRIDLMEIESILQESAPQLLKSLNPENPKYQKAVTGLYVRFLQEQMNNLMSQYSIAYGGGGTDVTSGLTTKPGRTGDQGTPVPMPGQAPPGANKTVVKMGKEKGTGRPTVMYSDGTTGYGDVGSETVAAPSDNMPTETLSKDEQERRARYNKAYPASGRGITPIQEQLQRFKAWGNR